MDLGGRVKKKKKSFGKSRGWRWEESFLYRVGWWENSKRNCQEMSTSNWEQTSGFRQGVEFAGKLSQSIRAPEAWPELVSAFQDPLEQRTIPMVGALYFRYPPFIHLPAPKAGAVELFLRFPLLATRDCCDLTRGPVSCSPHSGHGHVWGNHSELSWLAFNSCSGGP